MAGRERNQLNGNEAAEKQITGAEKGDQHTAKLQQDGLFGKAMEKAKAGDASKEVAEGGPEVTAERAMLALKRLGEAMMHPEQSKLLGGLISQSEGVFERVLLAGLHPTEDPSQKQKQQELFAMLQNSFTDSTKRT